MWDICLILAIAAFAGLVGAGLLLHRFKPNRHRALSRVNFTFAATAIAAFVLTLPVQVSSGCGAVAGAVITFQRMFQVFSLDGDYSSLTQAGQGSASSWPWLYFVVSAIIFTLAPIMTASVVLSFFRDISGQIRLALRGSRPVLVFSELNERSLALAKSCLDRKTPGEKKPMVVFTDVFQANDEKSYELRSRAEQMGAICFKKDLLEVRLGKHPRKVSFFIIGENDGENIDHALQLLNRYGQNEDTALYIFTASSESTLLLGSVVEEQVRMKVRRINQAQSLVYNYLYRNDIFSHAIDLGNGEKLLRVVIVGMGRYGTEFLKALTWAGQVPEVKLELHVFDQDRLAEDRFASMCPELMAMNGNDIPGECHYHITFHRAPDGRGLGAYTREFDRQISDLGPVSLAIVALGDDASDIEVSMKLRTLFRRSCPEVTPRIEAVVYQSTKPHTAEHYVLYDQKGMDADIHFIGDLRETFSYDFVLNSELERDAETRHLKWCDKADPNAVRTETMRFYRFEYFYRSSMASAIRYRLRLRLGVPGLEKPPAQRTEEERIAIQQMEHAGWNAYMRSEGYIYAPQRNDAAKQHHLLIPFDDLPYSEKIKDDD